MECKNCKYFRTWVTLQTKGDCHRYPPIFVEVNNSTDEFHEFTFPATNINDWCGEFKEKEM